MAIPPNMSQKLEQWYADTGDAEASRRQAASNAFVAASRNVPTIVATYNYTYGQGADNNRCIRFHKGRQAFTARIVDSNQTLISAVRQDNIFLRREGDLLSFSDIDFQNKEQIFAHLDRYQVEVNSSEGEEDREQVDSIILSLKEDSSGTSASETSGSSLREDFGITPSYVYSQIAPSHMAALHGHKTTEGARESSSIGDLHHQAHHIATFQYANERSAVRSISFYSEGHTIFVVLYDVTGKKIAEIEQKNIMTTFEDTSTFFFHLTSRQKQYLLNNLSRCEFELINHKGAPTIIVKLGEVLGLIE